MRRGIISSFLLAGLLAAAIEPASAVTISGRNFNDHSFSVDDLDVMSCGHFFGTSGGKYGEPRGTDDRLTNYQTDGLDFVVTAIQFDMVSWSGAASNPITFGGGKPGTVTITGHVTGGADEVLFSGNFITSPFGQIELNATKGNLDKQHELSEQYRLGTVSLKSVIEVTGGSQQALYSSLGFIGLFDVGMFNGKDFLASGTGTFYTPGNAVPEPGTAILMLSGLLAPAIRRRRAAKPF